MRKWVAQEGELVARALQKGNPWLYGALLNRFESLRAAAAHYGLPHRGLLESWNKERVVAAILARMREGGTLGAKAVQHQDGRLFDAAIRWHGSWGDAVRGAGIDYEQHLGRVEWTPERILERLRRWVAAHGPLSTSRLRDSDAALLGALEVRYKTVGEAARVLGLPYQPMKKTWTSGSVLAEIRALQGACTSGELRPIDLKRLDRALYFAARRRFGTVRRALAAAEGGREAGSV